MKVPSRAKRDQLLGLLAMLSTAPAALPFELWCEVSAHLAPAEHVALSATCRVLRRLTSAANDTAWRARLERDYGKIWGGDTLADYNRANGKTFGSWYAAYRATRGYVLDCLLNLKPSRRGQPWPAAVQALLLSGEYGKPYSAHYYDKAIEETVARLPPEIRLWRRGSGYCFLRALYDLCPTVAKLVRETAELTRHGASDAPNQLRLPHVGNQPLDPNRIEDGLRLLHKKADIRLLEALCDTKQFPINARTAWVWVEFLLPWCRKARDLPALIDRFGLHPIVPFIAKRDGDAAMELYLSDMLQLSRPSIVCTVIFAAVECGNKAVIQKMAKEKVRHCCTNRCGPCHIPKGGAPNGPPTNPLSIEVCQLAIDCGIVFGQVNLDACMKVLSHCPHAGALALSLIRTLPADELAENAVRLLLAAGTTARRLVDEGYVRPDAVTLREFLYALHWSDPRSINAALDSLAGIGIDFRALPNDFANTAELRSMISSVFQYRKDEYHKEIACIMFTRLGLPYALFRGRFRKKDLAGVL